MVISGHSSVRGQSEAIRGRPWLSVAIRGQSVAVRGRPWRNQRGTLAKVRPRGSVSCPGPLPGPPPGVSPSTRWNSPFFEKT